MESKDSKETTKFGRWKTMSRLVTHLKLAEHNYLYSYSLVLGSSQNCKDLMDRYKEKDLVDDLIQRKTEQKMYQADENFPTNEVDPACFLILVINEIISPKNMEQQIHPCPTVLPGSACLLGLGHLPRRGCQTPYRVRWRYLEGCWSWQDRWELGVGTPEPLI